MYHIKFQDDVKYDVEVLSEILLVDHKVARLLDERKGLLAELVNIIEIIIIITVNVLQFSKKKYR